MKVDFVLCYEHWQRELFALSKVKIELEKKGYKVKLLNIQAGVNDFLEKYFYEPEVVVFPWVYGDKELCLARSFKGNVQKVVNMQCEQLLSRRVLNNGFFKIRGEAKKAYHVSWGKNSYYRFKSYGVQEENILDVGNINLELNKEEYDNLFYCREQLGRLYGLDINKKWFLFCSNFKFTNASLIELVGFEERSSNIFLLRNQMCKAKKVILKWMKKYLEDNDDVEIIYRPHPVEKKDPYLENLALKYSNFKYISDLSINQWIRVCQRCATWNSTAILDGVSKGVPSRFILPYEMPEILKGDLDNICDKLTTFEELNNFLKDECVTNNTTEFQKYIQMDDTIQNFVEQLVNIHSKDITIFLDEKNRKSEWNVLSREEKCKMLVFWASKYIKIISIINNQDIYKEAYRIKKRERELFKGLRRNTYVRFFKE
mgnify:CR=1 FL=1